MESFYSKYLTVVCMALRVRWITLRNRVLSSKKFQDWSVRNWLTGPIAGRKAQRLFDLVAGFTYSQTLFALMQSGLLDRFSVGFCSLTEAANVANMSQDAAERLLKSGSALQLTEEVVPGIWGLGELGAALDPQEGVKAMIMHHNLLYADLVDPLSLLRNNREKPTRLSKFWGYAGRDDAAKAESEQVSPYSNLMGISQKMVSHEVLQTFDFTNVASLLDVGGGHGAFVASIAEAHPDVRLGVFDLPAVVEGAHLQFSKVKNPASIALHPGDFFEEPLPVGYDCISLVRILHDHDDSEAQKLLESVHNALPAGGILLIAEPMSDTKNAQAMGETYFGLYLWAMRSGRPRTVKEISQMIENAGFTKVKKLRVRQPLITSVVVATA